MFILSLLIISIRKNKNIFQYFILAVYALYFYLPALLLGTINNASDYVKYYISLSLVLSLVFAKALEKIYINKAKAMLDYDSENKKSTDIRYIGELLIFFSVVVNIIPILIGMPRNHLIQNPDVGIIAQICWQAQSTLNVLMPIVAGKVICNKVSNRENRIIALLLLILPISSGIIAGSKGEVILGMIIFLIAGSISLGSFSLFILKNKYMLIWIIIIAVIAFLFVTFKRLDQDQKLFDSLSIGADGSVVIMFYYLILGRFDFLSIFQSAYNIGADSFPFFLNGASYLHLFDGLLPTSLFPRNNSNLGGEFGVALGLITDPMESSVAMTWLIESWVAFGLIGAIIPVIFLLPSLLIKRSINQKASIFKIFLFISSPFISTFETNASFGFVRWFKQIIFAYAIYNLSNIFVKILRKSQHISLLKNTEYTLEKI